MQAKLGDNAPRLCAFPFQIDDAITVFDRALNFSFSEDGFEHACGTSQIDVQSS